VRQKKELIAVRFVHKNAPYNVGEIAGFPVDVARKLVQGKKAVFLGGDKADDDGKAKEAAPVAFEAVHVGGGYYKVGDHQVKGKKAAEKYAASLNEKSHGEAPTAEE